MVSVPLNKITTMMPAGGKVFESYEVGDDTFENVFGSDWYAQTFTPAVTHTVDKVWLLLSREGSPGTITVSIRATTGLKPSGSDLAVATRDGDLITTGTPQWYEFNLSTGVVVAAATTFAIVVRTAGADTDNDVQWRTDAGGGYANVGNNNESTDSGAAWTTFGPQDHMFKEGVA